MQTVIGAFDDRTAAQRAVDRLVQAGIDRQDVHLEQRDPSLESGAQPQRQSGHGSSGIGGFFSSLFGSEDQANTGHAHTYDEAVRRGSTVVVVDADNEQQADQACEILHELGAVDVDERSQQWRSEGWTGGAATGAAIPTGGMGQQTSMRTAGQDTDRLARGGSTEAGKEGVLDVVEEQLKVGKRSLDRGGVRVVQRVSQKPVRELLRLREEHAVVERRPVDREATGADLANFRESTLEVRETAEEPVVSKTARVVEEVRVGKEVREREETIEDTVRRKDVDVQRMEGGTRETERERAVASDRTTGMPPSGDRDPEGGASLTGTRKRGDKPVR